MLQAAHGLGHAVLRELKRRRPKSTKSPSLAIGIGSRVERAKIAGAKAILLVGAGNNGGDVLHAGALLAGRGVQVVALRLASDIHAAGWAALQRAGGTMRDGTELAAEELREIFSTADVVIDGIVGIGAQGPLRSPAAEVVTALNDVRQDGEGPLVVAADIPSGIAVDDGTVPGPAVRADVTVTFGAWKPGHALLPAGANRGGVHQSDLGLTEVLAKRSEEHTSELQSRGAPAC